MWFPSFHPLVKHLLDTKKINPSSATKYQEDIDAWEWDAKDFLLTMFSASDLWLSKEDLSAEDIMNEEELIKIQAVESLKSSSKNYDEKRIKTEYPVFQLIQKILKTALNMWVSDVHIEPLEDKVRVRFRVDWVLKEMQNFEHPIVIHKAFVAIVKMELAQSSDMVSYKHDEPQDWRAEILKPLFEKDWSPLLVKTESWEIIYGSDWKPKQQEAKVDLRISVLPQLYGEKIVFRLLDTSKWITKLDDMWFHKTILDKIKNWITMPQWLILVTWPTWSWKSTTLYSILQELNREWVNIQTFENPVEYKMYGVNQCPVNTSEWSKLTFAHWLRSALRQDPDIILVWEIRDAETAHIAIEASNTWHLVLSTLHQNDSTSVVERLLELWIDPKQLSTSIIFVSWQRLPRKICPHCKLKIKELKTLSQVRELVMKSEEYLSRKTKNEIEEKYTHLDMSITKNKANKIKELDNTRESYLMKQEKVARENLFKEHMKQEMIEQLSFDSVMTLYGADKSIKQDKSKFDLYKNQLWNAIENSYVHNPLGCSECNYTGYKGRISIQEVFFPNSETRKIIWESWWAQKLRDISMSSWFITMVQDWFMKILSWKTDYHDVNRVIRTMQ